MALTFMLRAAGITCDSGIGVGSRDLGIPKSRDFGQILNPEIPGFEFENTGIVIRYITHNFTQKNEKKTFFEQIYGVYTANFEK